MVDWLSSEEAAMSDREVVLGELQESRKHTMALLQSKLETMARQVQDLSTRIVGEMQTVLPPDPEVLFPLAAVGRRLAELTKPAPPAAAIGLETLRRLDAGRAQSEVLQELLNQLGGWAGERAIVVFREGQVTGWAGAGFAAGDPARSWRGAIADSPAVGSAVEGMPALTRTDVDHLLGNWFVGSARAVLVVPMSLRGKVVGALLASQGDRPFDTTIIQSLTYFTGLMLESMATRTTVPTPALRQPEEMAPSGAQPLDEPAEEAAPFGFEAEPEALAAAPAAVASARSAMAAEMPEGVDAGATVHLKISPQTMAPPPSAPPRSPDEDRRHEEAKRFARLLVSEIRLYNEQAVQDGKKARDIYHRLKEDIDRSQEMYEQRVPAEVRANSNYFFEELVRTLADGDPDALGL
jgi:hypothetical protein